MNSDASVLIDHYKNPRQKGRIDQPDLTREVRNRKCGDHLRFTVHLEGDQLRDIRFEGEGCFYCLTSASIACSTLTGKPVKQGLAEIERTRNWLAASGRTDQPVNTRIAALGEVKQFPMRIACVDLAWKGLEEMLRNR